MLIDESFANIAAETLEDLSSGLCLKPSGTLEPCGAALVWGCLEAEHTVLEPLGAKRRRDAEEEAEELEDEELEDDEEDDDLDDDDDDEDDFENGEDVGDDFEDEELEDEDIFYEDDEDE